MKDRVAVITGAAKGIGRQVALTFGREGAKVVVADVDEARLALMGNQLLSAHVEHLLVATDVQKEDSVRNLMDKAASHFGGIDVLVNDAGIVPHFAWGVPKWPAIRDMDEAYWDRVLRTNLGGTFLCTKHALPHIEERGGGHVVNLHGGGGMYACAYVVTKEAIRTFTRYVADEERQRNNNICVICVSPGQAIATEDAPEEARRKLPGPDSLEQLFLKAAQAPMDLSGETVEFKDGALRKLPPIVAR
jgi:NAD(P)-dependent dehydrogenase (short-subunit alcohol dehydrogenase family)